MHAGDIICLEPKLNGQGRNLGARSNQSIVDGHAHLLLGVHMEVHLAGTVLGDLFVA